MKFLIIIMLSLTTMNAFAITVDVALHNRPSSKVTNSDIANIATKAVADIKQYYLNNALGGCNPSKRVELEEEMVELIRNKTIKEIQVSLYEDAGISMVASFNEVQTKVALEVKLKNQRCSEFFFFKYIIWSDPV